VAEPFRVLVVANFPVNFTLESARRLVSIVNSGPSCGVYTLITHDPKAAVPQGFNLSDLEAGSINLTWKDGAFVWKDGDLAQFPLELEAPPTLDEVTRLVDVGLREGRTASRALGYQQVLTHLDGLLTVDEARAETARATRRFVRRQRSWFRRDPRIRWLPASDNPAAYAAIALTADEI